MENEIVNNLKKVKVGILKWNTHEMYERNIPN